MTQQTIPSDQPIDPQAAKPALPTWQIELLWAAAGIAIALLLLPLAIFFVGKHLLGDYGGGSLGSFYGNYFGSLASGSKAAWSLALGPALAFAAIRHSLRLYRPSKTMPNQPDETVPVARQAETGKRREPFVGN